MGAGSDKPAGGNIMKFSMIEIPEQQPIKKFLLKFEENCGNKITLKLELKQDEDPKLSHILLFGKVYPSASQNDINFLEGDMKCM